MQVRGLRFWPNFVSVAEERELLDVIYEDQWNSSLDVRTQNYGYQYSYIRKTVVVANPLPVWSHFLVDRLLDSGILKKEPDQLTVNEYVAGRGFSPQIEDIDLYEDGIVIISIGSDITMDFSKGCSQKHVKLACGSAISLFGDARYDWKHGIMKRMDDYGIKRGTTVLLTFRQMKGRKRAKVEAEPE